MATPLLLLLLGICIAAADPLITVDSIIQHSQSYDGGLCLNLIQPSGGYSCFEHTAETKDGFLLGLQRVSLGIDNLGGQRAAPVLLLHGLFMGGDAWFMNSPSQSLGFILADCGFDVWVGNVRGTKWSHGHTSLSVSEKEFWDWSWQEMALYDLEAMLSYIYSTTSSKVFVVGHSQGTIMSLAAFTQPNIVNMVEAAGLLSPISYLDHITSKFVRNLVNLHLEEVLSLLGIHQLNLKSDILTTILEMACDGNVDCSNLLAAITGVNCCFNSTRVDFYLEYEPHPSSLKNLKHLFQMIRKGTFARYDYGTLKNILQYGQSKPPTFDLGDIPESLPIWMAHGGNDALGDVIDVHHTVKELKSKPNLLFLEDYGHVDFLLSTRANVDLYDKMIKFFTSCGTSSSS
uniref:triacylglycerol lipase 1 n=1 Tax=Erigeron canadensis TaxID=72917 RepID=UPI001CB955A4|nr:triacylglycerol lipase 1 [Erigeron canadensis]XP_043625006.1 triacylglycerol lipase 1 [Erigeron canadensis]